MSWVITGSQKVNWDPSLITTALWLDAADNTTIFSDAGTTQAVAGTSTVQQWNDKSGNGRNASQSTVGSRPSYTAAGQNGRNTITFDGSSDGLSLATGLSLGTAHSIFLVAKNSATITSATSAQLLLNGGSYTFPSTTTSEFLLGAGSLTGALVDERLYSVVVAHNSAVADVWGHGKTNADVSGAFILGSSFTTAGNVFTGRLNGENDLTTAAGFGNRSYSSTNTRYPTFAQHIGFRGVNNTLYWSGDINEIIVTTAFLATFETQRIEGYLAHKWGLTANLPSDHPFKVNPPAP
jgi:hypothetical protein